MITKLSNCVITDASSFVSLYAAIVDGGSPILTALVSLSPFIFALFDLVLFESAYMISLLVTLIILFTLGMYLGKIAKENALLLESKH